MPTPTTFGFVPAVKPSFSSPRYWHSQTSFASSAFMASLSQRLERSRDDNLDLDVLQVLGQGREGRRTVVLHVDPDAVLPVLAADAHPDDAGRLHQADLVTALDLFHRGHREA